MMQSACTRSVPVRMGEPFTLNELTYIVKDRTSKAQFVIPRIGETIDAGRNATFIVVELEIINNGKRTIAVYTRSFELQTAEGIHYRPDLEGTAAQTALEMMEKGSFEKSARGAILRPRIPMPYKLVFRVPYEVAHGPLILVVYGPSFFFDTRAVVTLQ